MRLDILLLIDDLARKVFALFYLLEQSWAEIVAATLRPKDWDKFNTYSYSKTQQYGRPSHKGGLFHWEIAAIEKYFPPAPAHLLLTGAGGGREAIALAKMGYKLSVLEPVPALLKVIRDSIPKENLQETFCGTYQDWIASADVTLAGPFDGAILGRGSFSHIALPDERLEVLRKVRALTPAGPALISWMGQQRSGAKRLMFRKLLKLVGLKAVSSDDRYQKEIGIYHCFNPNELEALAKQTSYKFLLDTSLEAFPNALLVPDKSVS